MYLYILLLIMLLLYSQQINSLALKKYKSNWSFYNFANHWVYLNEKSNKWRENQINEGKQTNMQMLQYVRDNVELKVCV